LVLFTAKCILYLIKQSFFIYKNKKEKPKQKPKMKLFSFVEGNVLFSLLVDITKRCAKAKKYVKTKKENKQAETEENNYRTNTPY